MSGCPVLGSQGLSFIETLRDERAITELPSGLQAIQQPVASLLVSFRKHDFSFRLNQEIDMNSSVFVYGTLKRGQCRGAMWPVKPLKVSEVYTYGTLFSRQDYPAMVGGMDRVAGERWDFNPDQMPRVLEVLDRIEGANQSGQPDLYRRVLVMTWGLRDEGNGLLETGESRIAFTYHYATEPANDGFIRILPNDFGLEPDHSGLKTGQRLVSWPT